MSLPAHVQARRQPWVSFLTWFSSCFFFFFKQGLPLPGAHPTGWSSCPMSPKDSATFSLQCWHCKDAMPLPAFFFLNWSPGELKWSPHACKASILQPSYLLSLGLFFLILILFLVSMLSFLMEDPQFSCFRIMRHITELAFWVCRTGISREKSSGPGSWHQV